MTVLGVVVMLVMTTGPGIIHITFCTMRNEWYELMCSDFPEHLTQDMDMDMGKIAVIAIVAAVPVITDATAVAVIVHPVIAGIAI